jgi:hypothetical protein
VHEIDGSENHALQEVMSQVLELSHMYRDYGYDISAAWLVWFMHIVATLACLFGPRIMPFVSGEDSFKSNPSGLLPDLNMSAIELFYFLKTITLCLGTSLQSLALTPLQIND